MTQNFNKPENVEGLVAAKLVLDDGTELAGASFGDLHPVGGEVVFNTGMAGYIESLTDPSYKGQILVLTYPLIGNYGVPHSRTVDSLDRPFESNQIQVQGLVVQNYVDEYSHHAAARSLATWLKDDSVPGVYGIDTRFLTRHLREHGTMRGWLLPASMELDEAKEHAASIDMREEVFHSVAPDGPKFYQGSGPKVLLIDVGAKDNIVRSLLARGASVVRAPWNTDLTEYFHQVDGVLIGNGPGDPKDLMSLVEQIRTFLTRFDKPVFGICLGNQLLALAAGGDTYKLPYGHRGVNQPVQDLLTRRSYITSQNHGYAIREESLPSDWEPWFINVNDGTNEGIRSRTRCAFGVQFHPEASPGPCDTGFLFDEFLRHIGAPIRG